MRDLVSDGLSKTEGKKPSPTPPPRPKRAPKVEEATGEGGASNAA